MRARARVEAARARACGSCASALRLHARGAGASAPMRLRPHVQALRRAAARARARLARACLCAGRAGARKCAWRVGDNLIPITLGAQIMVNAIGHLTGSVVGVAPNCCPEHLDVELLCAESSPSLSNDGVRVSHCARAPTRRPLPVQGARASCARERCARALCACTRAAQAQARQRSNGRASRRALRVRLARACLRLRKARTRAFVSILGAQGTTGFL